MELSSSVKEKFYFNLIARIAQSSSKNTEEIVSIFSREDDPPFQWLNSLSVIEYVKSRIIREPA